MNRTWLKIFALLMSFALVAGACGSSGDDDAGSGDDTEASGSDGDAMEEDGDAMEEEDGDAMEEEGEGHSDGLATSGSVEVAAGTTLALDDCPDDWSATTGVDGDEIRIGQSLPQSGQLAAFGAIGEGMQMWFDYINETDPIDGKTLTLVARDDGYEAGRAVANVEEMLETEDIFAFMHTIGTPINAAIRPITDEACVPQLFNSSGFPFWGDPGNWPWTVGNILNYVTETEMWCGEITEEFGAGATVATLIMNNDFGKTYQNTLATSPLCADIELVEEQLHDPAAPDITNEMSTLIATDADVLVLGTTSAFCPQTVGNLAAAEWRPRVFMSYTCNNLSAFFAPVQEQAAALAAEGSAVRMANSNKVCGDPAYADDPAILLIEEVLETYGGVTCADGSFSTGVLYGQFATEIIRNAAAMPGGLNRVNLMAATWNADTNNDTLLGGSLKLDGVNDAYWTEAAQIQEVVVVDGALGFNPVGEVIDLEGQGGSFG